MSLFPNKENTPDLSKEAAQKSYVENTSDSKSLMQKELDVNRAAQQLLKKRISMMKSLINELPSSDPQYSMLLTQIQMDQIEMDEFKVQEARLIQNLSK